MIINNDSNENNEMFLNEMATFSNHLEKQD